MYADTTSSTLYMWHTRQPKGNSDAPRRRKKSSVSDDPVPSQERYGVLWLSQSQDWGQTWHDAKRFDTELGTWGRNRVLLGLDGSWMFPIYNESEKPLGHDHEYSLLLRKGPEEAVLTTWQHQVSR